MQNSVNASVDVPLARHVLDAQREARVPGEMVDVAGGTGDQIVDGNHLGTVGEQAIDEVRPEKSCAAGDNHTRRRPGHRTAIRSGTCLMPDCVGFAVLGLRMGRPTAMYVNPRSTKGSAARQLRPSTTIWRRTNAATRDQSRPTYSGHSVTTITASAAVTQAYGSPTSSVLGSNGLALLIATGSVATTTAPRSSRWRMTSIDAAWRTSSVPGLKASPSTAMRRLTSLPFNARWILATNLLRACWFTSTAARSSWKLCP